MATRACSGYSIFLFNLIGRTEFEPVTSSVSGKPIPSDAVARRRVTAAEQGSAVAARCSVPDDVWHRCHLVSHSLRRCGRRCIRYSVDMSYQPMTLADLARLVAAEAGFDSRWRLVVEFLKEYHQEVAGARLRLLEDAPGPVGDERWDVLFAGLAEHLAMRDGRVAPDWAATRGLRRFWFPFDTPGARAQALVHSPAAFRRRGVFVPDYEIDAA